MKTLDQVSAILSELSGIESIAPEQELQADLGLDSLRLVTLLVMLEEGFRIVLDEADMNPFDLLTVAHVVGLVEKYIGGEDDAEKDT